MWPEIHQLCFRKLKAILRMSDCLLTWKEIADDAPRLSRVRTHVVCRARHGANAGRFRKSEPGAQHAARVRHGKIESHSRSGRDARGRLRFQARSDRVS